MCVFSCCSWMFHRCIIHVIDTDANSRSASGWLEDTSKVQKYVMSDEDYAKRKNTYKQFKTMKQKVSFFSICQTCLTFASLVSFPPIWWCWPILALVYTVKAAHQLAELLPSSQACNTKTSHSKFLVCFQEDPEWTAEKELCQRKGVSYQAPKKKVRPLSSFTTTNDVLASLAASSLLVLFHR